MHFLQKKYVLWQCCRQQYASSTTHKNPIKCQVHRRFCGFTVNSRCLMEPEPLGPRLRQSPGARPWRRVPSSPAGSVSPGAAPWSTLGDLPAGGAPLRCTWRRAPCTWHVVASRGTVLSAPLGGLHGASGVTATRLNVRATPCLPQLHNVFPDACDSETEG